MFKSQMKQSSKMSPHCKLSLCSQTHTVPGDISPTLSMHEFAPAQISSVPLDTSFFFQQKTPGLTQTPATSIEQCYHIKRKQTNGKKA